MHLLSPPLSLSLTLAVGNTVVHLFAAVQPVAVSHMWCYVARPVVPPGDAASATDTTAAVLALGWVWSLTA